MSDPSPALRTLADLRAGDEVVVCGRFPTTYTIRRVLRLTPKQIVLDGTYLVRYHKHGLQIGGDNRLSLEPAAFAAARNQAAERAQREESARVVRRHAEYVAARERVAAYLNARSYGKWNQLIAAIGGEQLRHDDLVLLLTERRE